jgi:putative transposase
VVNVTAEKRLLRPTKTQIEAFTRILSVCRELYNAAIQERRDAWRLMQLQVRENAQHAALPEIKALRADVASVHSQVLADVVKRVGRAFAGFFRRVKRGEAPGYPRFKLARRYDSFTFPQCTPTRMVRGVPVSNSGGAKILDTGRLRIHGVPGNVRVNWHRPLRGRLKTVTIKREGNRWYAIFVCEVERMPLPVTGRNVAVDLGVEAFATLHDGERVPNPRYLAAAQAKLRRAQRRRDRRKKFGGGWRKAAAEAATIHRKIANRRRDFHHKVARDLVNRFDRIAVERLNVEAMSRGLHSKSVHDVGWSSFLAILRAKAEGAGREVVAVDARHTSQTCPGCGAVEPKKLSQRRHRCECGLDLHRDHAAALNIYARAFGPIPLGLSGQGVVGVSLPQ